MFLWVFVCDGVVVSFYVEDAEGISVANSNVMRVNEPIAVFMVLKLLFVWGEVFFGRLFCCKLWFLGLL